MNVHKTPNLRPVPTGKELSQGKYCSNVLHCLSLFFAQTLEGFFEALNIVILSSMNVYMLS